MMLVGGLVGALVLVAGVALPTGSSRLTSGAGPRTSATRSAAPAVLTSRSARDALPPAATTDGGLAPHDAAQLIVSFDSAVTPASRVAIEALVGGHELRVLAPGLYLLGVPSGSVPAALRKLSVRAGVRHVEPNYYASVAATPNDPSFPQQWADNNTGQTVNGIRGTAGADERTVPAWATTTGSASIVIGEVDTGVDYTHPDLAKNVWVNPGGIGGCAAGTRGYNVLSGTCDPMDDDASYGGHGSHVAGIMGAVGNNGTGVAGVNWTTTILPVKWVNSSGVGTTADLISGLNWLVGAQAAGVNIRVVNDSDVFFGTAYSQALSDEIDVLGQHGILFVTAAGNTGDNNDNPALRRYPCGYQRATEICVTASDQNDNLPSWANRGAATVDLAAPGDNIYSTLRNGTYGYLSGGSMASPQVAGTAALVLSRSNLDTVHLKADLLEHVDPVAGLAGMVRTGGRLDVCRAVPGCTSTTALTAPFAISAPSVATTSAQAGAPSPEPQVGQVLAGNQGTWDGAPTSFAYQWLRCASGGGSCSAIAGATSISYSPVGSDVGQTLVLQVVATNAAGSTTAASPPTQVVQPAVAGATFGKTTIGATSDSGDADYQRVDAFPVPQPVVVSKLTVYLQRAAAGQQLVKGVIYADQGGAPGALVATSQELTFGASAGSGWYDLLFSASVPIGPGTYWIGLIDGPSSAVVSLRYDESTAASGAVAAAPYSGGPPDPFGPARLQYEQMSIYATYTSGSPPPAPQAPVDSVVPSVSGVAEQGSVLTASTGTWSGSPTGYAYQWLRCGGGACTAVAGASASTYALGAADVGSTLEVTVTASNAGGSATATSAPTVTVVGAPSGGGTFGQTSIGGSSDTMLANRKRVESFALGVAGQVTKLSMYLQPTGTGGSQQLIGLLYADGGGSPAGLLGSTVSVTFSSTDGAGWYDLTFAAPVSLQPGQYWIGVMSGGASYVAGFRWTSVSGARRYNANMFANGPSNPFGTTNTDSEQMSIYATYT